VSRAWLGVVLVLVATAAHAGGIWPDGPRSRWFKSLMQPNGGASCCDVSDCHATQARQAADGHWQAIMEDVTGKAWVDVPPDKVLKKPLSIDGEAYICNSMGGGAEFETSSVHGTIYCFLPPIPGY